MIGQELDLEKAMSSALPQYAGMELEVTVSTALSGKQLRHYAESQERELSSVSLITRRLSRRIQQLQSVESGGYLSH
jgi:hypothetical protein